MSDEKEPPIGRRDAMAGLAGLVLATGCESRPAESSAQPRAPRERTTMRQPTLYIPHGGGPCFFMEWRMGPPDTWDRMAAWLRSVVEELPERPKALLVVSAHWEQSVPTVTEGASSTLLYDYSGFPQHTYELTWPAAGDPGLAARTRELLEGAGISTAGNTDRGLDHGVFIPLKLSVPDADIPTVQLSLVRGLDPAAHIAIGKALAPLRDEGVLIVGSGMSYHDMRGFGRPASLPVSQRFDRWLAETMPRPEGREAALERWEDAPEGRACHPREEHLLPLMVVAGAAEGDAGERVFGDQVMGVEVSAYRFG